MANQSKAATCGIYLVTTSGGRYSSHQMSASSPADAEAQAKQADPKAKIISTKLQGRAYATMTELHQANCAHEWEETFGDDDDRFEYYGCPHCGASRRTRISRIF